MTIEYDRYLLGPDPAALSPYPVLEGETRLKIPGKTALPGWNVRADITGPPEKIEIQDQFTACFDLKKTGEELAVRRRRPGDRFQPLGMGQAKKLNEYLIDARIPQSWRGRIPVVVAGERIVWLVGQRIDERFKVTDNTVKVLRLEFKRSG